MDYRIEDDFAVSAERYWEIFFSQEFNEAMWKALDIGWELISLEKKGEGKDLVITRKQKLTPKREVPKLIEKLVKGAIAYTEENVFTAANDTMKTKTVSNFASDRIENHGTFRIQRIGDDKVKRTWEGVCVCKVPLLGGKIEKILVDEIRESYRRSTEFTRKWHAEHR